MLNGQPFSKPLTIAGPCSAESEDQLYETCSKIKEFGVQLFRAGVWKPRTRPGSFEGHGEEALKWIQSVKKSLEIPFVIEAAKPKHVELALKYNIDALWIGARTTVNPFQVREIAESLRGVQVPVFIKNPVNPDLNLWIGAFERISGVGINQTAAIHRGFSPFEPSAYRNVPAWRIPLEFKSLFPEIPMLCDPSHIAGKQKYIKEIAQKALDLNYDGLMIEVHREPAKAESDPDQQLTPKAFGKLIQELKFRKSNTDNVGFINKLEEIRENIDESDHAVIEALASRMNKVGEIGKYKKQNNVAVFQPDRWKSVFETRPDWGKEVKLSEEFIRKLYQLIHEESIRIQTDIMNEK